MKKTTAKKPPVPIEANPRVAVGGNSPPPDMQIEKFLPRQAEITATAKSWAKLGKVADAEQAELLEGFKKQVTGLSKDADAARLADQKPHRDVIAIITEAYRPLLSACDTILARIEPLRTAWLKSEKDRLDAEARAKAEAAEAERIAAEELQQQAIDSGTIAAQLAAEEATRKAEQQARDAERAAKEKPKMGGSYVVDGVKRSASLRTFYDYTVSDPRKAAIALCRQPEVIEAMVKAARRLHTKDRELVISGITITGEERAAG